MRIELTQDGECWHVWIDGQHHCDLCGTSLSEVLDLLRAKLPEHLIKSCGVTFLVSKIPA